MSLQGKPVDDITEADLQDLLANPIAERKNIEYKASLPDWNDYESKKEFLADVSSFANAAGGHLLLGVEEAEGLPVGLPGLQGINADDEKQRVENLLRDCIEPRIWGLSLAAVSLQNSGVVIVIQIPKSWNAPHVAKIKGHWRFYSRNSAGKYPLDVSELRALFELSRTAAERIRDFRAERLGKIVAEETPVALRKCGKITLHIIPLGAFNPSVGFDLSQVVQNPNLLVPASLYRYNFDGYMAASISRSGLANSYTQVFRNGILEYVDADLLGDTLEDRNYIPSEEFEKVLIEILPKLLSIQKLLSIELPLVIMVSLLEVFGHIMAVNKRRFRHIRDYPIDRETLMIPEIMIDDFDVDATEVLRPAFDAIWNAAGWPRSMNYDQTGKWVGQR